MSTVAATNTEETKVAEAKSAPDTDEEPQNTLTRKFTDKEWVALKEFRVRATKGPACDLLSTVCSLSITSRTYLKKRMMVRKAHGPRPS